VVLLGAATQIEPVSPVQENVESKSFANELNNEKARALKFSRSRATAGYSGAPGGTRTPARRGLGNHRSIHLSYGCMFDSFIIQNLDCPLQRKAQAPPN
jgi:hypothetical protein